jgi:hypothetical protein
MKNINTLIKQYIDYKYEFYSNETKYKIESDLKKTFDIIQKLCYYKIIVLNKYGVFDEIYSCLER